MTNAATHSLYVFDQDGTLYLGDDALPGAREFTDALRERGALLRFMSNNPTKDCDQYVTKLRRLGFQCEPEEVLTTVQATCLWLLQHRPGATVFPIAEQPLIDALQDAGIAITDDPAKIDIVISSYDRTFTYNKLQIAFDAIWKEGRAELIATNPDRYCPFPGGRGEPDCAAITAAIEACTGTHCAEVIGKPNPQMLLPTLEQLGVTPEQTLVVGDRLGTDIQLGLNVGTDTALVLTGDSTMAEATAAPTQPTYIVRKLTQLLG